MVDTTALMASLPSDALREAFVNYDEEIDHPALMADYYIDYLIEEGELSSGDKIAFIEWKRKHQHGL